jgi:hypothetical protein
MALAAMIIQCMAMFHGIGPAAMNIDYITGGYNNNYMQ